MLRTAASIAISSPPSWRNMARAQEGREYRAGRPAEAMPAGYAPPTGPEQEGPPPPIPPFVDGPAVRHRAAATASKGRIPSTAGSNPASPGTPPSGRHIHGYPPFDLRLFNFQNGCYYFIGDPTDFGYAATPSATTARTPSWALRRRLVLHDRPPPALLAPVVPDVRHRRLVVLLGRSLRSVLLDLLAVLSLLLSNPLSALLRSRGVLPRPHGGAQNHRRSATATLRQCLARSRRGLPRWPHGSTRGRACAGREPGGARTANRSAGPEWRIGPAQLFSTSPTQRRCALRWRRSWPQIAPQINVRLGCAFHDEVEKGLHVLAHEIGEDAVGLRHVVRCSRAEAGAKSGRGWRHPHNVHELIADNSCGCFPRSVLRITAVARRELEHACTFASDLRVSGGGIGFTSTVRVGNVLRQINDGRPPAPPCDGRECHRIPEEMECRRIPPLQVFNNAFRD
jgi:hypothetical protein